MKIEVGYIYVYLRQKFKGQLITTLVLNS